jgi:hypothetical protein
MAPNTWNEQHKKWFNFSYNEGAIKAFELKFSQNSETVLGTFKRVNENEKEQLIIEILANEALKIAEIEGDYLDERVFSLLIKKI